MKFKKMLLIATMSLFCSVALASHKEIASKVISVKVPVVDNQVTHHHATEVFMELINRGKKTHALVAATSPAAAQVQLHMTFVKNGREGMRQIPRIIIKRHDDKDLHLGGLHVMLISLKKHLVKNQQVPITLIFADGSWIKVNAKVS